MGICGVQLEICGVQLDYNIDPKVNKGHLGSLLTLFTDIILY